MEVTAADTICPFSTVKGKATATLMKRSDDFGIPSIGISPVLTVPFHYARDFAEELGRSNV